MCVMQAIDKCRHVFISVLIDDYKSYNLQLNDVWAMKGGTAIFKCNINPFFVNDYISIVSWTQGTKSISAGLYQL